MAGSTGARPDAAGPQRRGPQRPPEAARGVAARDELGAGLAGEGQPLGPGETRLPVADAPGAAEAVLAAREVAGEVRGAPHRVDERVVARDAAEPVEPADLRPRIGVQRLVADLEVPIAEGIPGRPAVVHRDAPADGGIADGPSLGALPPTGVPGLRGRAQGHRSVAPVADHVDEAGAGKQLGKDRM